jgi:hypothetical protein
MGSGLIFDSQLRAGEGFAANMRPDPVSLMCAQIGLANLIAGCQIFR